ncbi:hypothetical protein EDD85DRAFT_787018 [Armillaria nabsnona]|nr:hypothetical protein EDD85DRAFT_787018 [Armillaria nabsnona]
MAARIRSSTDVRPVSAMVPTIFCAGCRTFPLPMLRIGFSQQYQDVMPVLRRITFKTNGTTTGRELGNCEDAPSSSEVYVGKETTGGIDVRRYDDFRSIVSYFQGLVFENVYGVNMEDLKFGVVVYQREAEAISSREMGVFHAIEAENCVERHFAVIIDFGFAIIRRPGCNDKEWKDVVEGHHDTCNIRGARGRGWRKNVDSRYDNPEVL